MSLPTPEIPLADVDLTDLDAFARNEGWSMFDTLRGEDPVHWTEEAAPNSGFWAVTKHADICAVDKDPEVFTSQRYVNLEEVDDDRKEAEGSSPGVGSPGLATLDHRERVRVSWPWRGGSRRLGPSR